MRKKLRPSLFKGKEREPSYESIMDGLPEGVALIDEDGEVLDCELIAIEHEMARRYKEIVRCKDCEFAAYERKECMRVDEWDDSLWFPIEPEGFCA